MARTPLDLHGYLEHQIFQKNEIQDLRCPGDDCAHFDYWRERADFVSSDRVSEILDQKIDDLRQEVEQTFSEIMGREAEIVGEIVARRGVAEAVEHIEQMHIRAFVI
ncbi:hypothetical protein [Roseibium sp.]|uniref:hypothetical protein n=1 Tax=Roseibium sp. TaxID=1936156 RepID=UPI003BA9A3F4